MFLLLIRYLPIILAIVLLIALILMVSILLKNMIEGRLDRRKAKNKAKFGNLPTDAGIRELVVAGNIAEAIDLYQRFTGVDEFTARDAIEDLQREVRLSIRDNELRSILSHEGKAAAIQAYQAQANVDFDVALKYVEKIESE